MRNPFKKVFCEDCEHCILATKYTDIKSQLEFSRCKVDPKATRNRISRRPELKEYYHCSVRQFSFCFKFKERTK